MNKTVERANAFLKEHSGKTKGRYRPRYHACVPVGWANDPNGLIFFGGKAHLFCQYNPYHPYWESMHWGAFCLHRSHPLGISARGARARSKL